MLVTTKPLPRQTRVCVARKNILPRHTFVVTKICRGKHTFLATKDDLFVATKMVLVAAPANVKYQAGNR